MKNRRERVFSGRAARQGEIILKSRLSRIIFIAGLAGFVLLALYSVFA